MRKLIESLFNIRPEEQTKALLMLLYSTCIIAAAFVVARTVSSTLFLKRIDPKYLPLTYIATAVFVSLASTLYAKIGDRLRRDRTIVASFALFTVVILVLRGALEVASHSLLLMGSLFVFVEVMGSVSIIQFWTFANTVFTTREAKRLFAFIGAGGTIAGVLFGAIVRTTVPFIGAPNLLFMMAGLLVICIFLVSRLGRLFAGELEGRRQSSQASQASPPRNLLADFRQLTASSHLRTIAASVAVISAVVVFVDYQFMITARQAFGDENALAAFFGSFYLYTGVIAFVFQFFITSRLLERYGIFFALLFLPAILLLMSVGLLAVSATQWVLRVATGAKGSDNVIRYSINNPAFELLYLPVPADFRSRAKALTDGMIKPVATGLAGLLILVLVNFVATRHLSFVVILLIAGWILLLVSARRQYLRSLAETIRRRKLDLHGSTLPVDDATVKALENALRADDERNAYNALELLDAVPEADWDPLVGRLLQSRSRGLRKRAVEYLGRRAKPAYAETVAPLFEDEDPEVRAAALDAYSRIQGENGVMALHPHLQDPDPYVKATVVASMIQYGGIDGILMAADELKAMWLGDDWRMRLAGAKVLERIKVRQFYQPLEALLADENPRVQIGAIQAAGEIKSPFLLPLLVDKLGLHRTARAATLALAAYGAEAVRPLRAVLENPAQRLATCAQIPKILRLIGTQQSLYVLSANLHAPNEKLRSNIVTESANLLRGNRLLVVDSQRIEARIAAETEDYYQQILTATVLDGRVGGSLLSEVLHLRIRRSAQRVLTLLAISHPDQPIESIAHGLRSAAAATRANAVELLDNLLEGDLKRPILAIFEDDSLARKLKSGQAHFPRLRQDTFTGWLGRLLADDDPWTVACAIHQVGVLKLQALTPKLEAFLNADDPLIMETTLIALAALTDPARFDRLLKTAAARNDHLAAFLHARRGPVFTEPS